MFPRAAADIAVGKPYMIAGRFYFPAEDPNYRAEGIASWYGRDFHGSRTANGEIYNMYALTAAHPTLPMPSYVRVTNQLNGRSIIVRVNDRGPFRGGRVIDVSVKTAELLGFHSSGLAPVRVEYVGRASRRRVGRPHPGGDAAHRGTGSGALGRQGGGGAHACSGAPEPAGRAGTRRRGRSSAPSEPRREPPEIAAAARARPERMSSAPPPAAFAPVRSEGSFLTGRGLY